MNDETENKLYKQPEIHGRSMLQPVKGMTDFYPSDKAVQQAVFSVLRETARKFGFLEVETPALESVELLTRKSGAEIREQLFVLEKRSNEELALRFDLTVPLTRLFVQKQRELPKPVKWFGMDKMWRYEAPQKGRLREFFQLSVELFGSDKPEADAEIVLLAIECLKNLGLSAKDVVVKVNNRKFLEGFLSAIAPEFVERLIALIDKSSRISRDELVKELSQLNAPVDKVLALLELKGSAGRVLPELRKLAQNSQSKAGVDELEQVTALLPGDWVDVDVSVARGLAYYTGTVFEVFDRGGRFRAIAGGGRYDNLVQLFGGEACPATGFGMGYATLSLLLEEKKLLPAPFIGPDFYIAPISRNELPVALELAKKLRKKYSVSIDLLQRRVSKQFDYANSICAKQVIVIGEQEVKEGVVTVKDMKSGGDEKRSMDSF